MTIHTSQAYRLPEGGLMVAEEHTLTAAGLEALAAGWAEQPREGAWTWSTATEGDQTPGG